MQVSYEESLANYFGLQRRDGSEGQPPWRNLSREGVHRGEVLLNRHRCFGLRAESSINWSGTAITTGSGISAIARPDGGAV